MIYNVGNLGPLDNWISNSNVYINKQLKQTCTDSKRPHTITKMNDNINMDSKITGSMNDNINMDSKMTGSVNALS